MTLKKPKRKQSKKRRWKPKPSKKLTPEERKKEQDAGIDRVMEKGWL